MMRFLLSLFQLILAPEKGWEDISADGKPFRELAFGGLYPLLGFASVTVFISALYHIDTSLTVLLQKAIVEFVSLFLSYFIAVGVLSIYIHRFSDTEVSEKRNHTYVIYSIGLLSLVWIIQNCLPMELAITNFLPIYIAIVMWRGMKYMGIRHENVGQFMLLAIACVIAPPYVIRMLFNLFIPNS